MDQPFEPISAEGEQDDGQHYNGEASNIEDRADFEVAVGYSPDQGDKDGRHVGECLS